MTLRAADKKDEHGWQILDAEGNVVGHQPSRDKARTAAKLGISVGRIATIPMSNGQGGERRPIAKVNPILKEPAREILPADNSPEALAARSAHEIDQRIKATIRRLKEGWVDLAADLYVFYKGKLWDKLGYESWHAYLSDPDVEIEVSAAYRHVATYEQLVIDRGVEPERLKQLHMSKVFTVLPAVRRDQVSVEQAFADVEAHPKSNLEAIYQGKHQPDKRKRGKPDTSPTIHTESEPEWAVCPSCGSRYRVDPETGERVT